MLALIVVAACTDASESPTLPNAADPLSSAGVPGAGLVNQGDEFTCVVAANTPSGWQVRSVPVAYPRGMLHPEGTTFRYRYRGVTEGGDLVRIAECDVPMRAQALRLLGRWLEVPQELLREQLDLIGTRGDDVPGIQGCVDDGACAIEGFVVVGTSGTDDGSDVCDPWLDMNWCQDDQCLMSVNLEADGSVGIQCGGAPGGGPGGSPDGGELDDSFDDDCYHTGVDGECLPYDAYAAGPLLWASCVLAVAGSTVSIDQVASSFESWHGIIGDLNRIEQMLVDNPDDPALLYLRDYLLQRHESLRREIARMSFVSGATLVAAMVTCSPKALIPSP